MSLNRKTFSLVVSALAMSLIVTPMAQAHKAVHDIGKNDPLRKPLLDLIRPVAAKDLGNPVEFKVNELRSDGDMAFAAVVAQRPGGKSIDPKKTPYVRKLGTQTLEFWDCCHMEAVFKRENGHWIIAESALGSTDVWWESWCDKSPKGLINACHK